eukprot:TRINITY_DN48360_c0_g1_i1.p1 TRINITY_DN48360_c0_g1~~TRINITY_DN48360_c0_g1_i1.p1  ORF type:complete len:459 (+),score=86.09 TRINITY_DN48360_c0_g1_i1:32-1408(+)
MVKRLAGFPAATPEDAGFNKARFAQFRAALRRETSELNSLPGAAHIVLHKGRCVFACSDGVANIKTRTRFSLDTICALHGATKPIVVTAFLTLVDEGKVKLSDPVSKHVRFPQTARVGRKAAKPVAARPVPTIRHLLTMTCGLDDRKAVKQVQEGKVVDLAGLCEALADTPLLAQPGTRYEYGFTVEILGKICEALSGETLERFVERKVLKPLGMKDTHFVLPASKKKRLAPLYDAYEKKRGQPLYGISKWTHPERAPGILSPGGGILSYHDAGMYGTAKDYARFCQMLVDGGVGPDGTRLLRASTVKQFWQDSLALYAGRDGFVAGWSDSPEPEWAESILNQKAADFWDKNSWSLLNTHLLFQQPPRSGGPSRRSHTMWMGGGGGAFWVVDSKRKIAAVSMVQCFGGRVVGEADRADEEGAALDCLSRPMGRDVTPIALAAYDEGKASRRLKRRRIS